MNVMEAIAKRQSCRAYTGEQITQEELSVILKAANAAPVGKGSYEDVKLTVIQNSSLLTKLDKAAEEMLRGQVPHPMPHPTYEAPTLILVTVKPQEGPLAGVPYCNASCIMENMWLAATELGLGSVFLMGVAMAFSGNKELSDEAKIPEGFAPVALLAVGKPAQPLKDRELTDTKIVVEFV
ncbi:nitroreductase family protein [Desulfosporosinus fructosivorans]|uniref:Nitroreductase family protein n=1 Tax=Desulfosporosinus fructosivorans TaxID=2018669 RepID=A0A4Z0R0W9_9FIRM|nr:nitroreductase family protein [Desulfosporosinus fructosivorans]TGE36179.1 nitroreductase family protein [Desulfosporosinus fructosivorans]